MLHVLLMSRVLFVCRMSYVCMCTPHTPNTRAGSLTMGPWSVIVSRHIHTQLARAANRSIYLYITHIYRIWLKRSVHATFIVLCFVALWMWFSVFSLPFFPYSLCFFFGFSSVSSSCSVSLLYMFIHKLFDVVVFLVEFFPLHSQHISDRPETFSRLRFRLNARMYITDIFNFGQLKEQQRCFDTAIDEFAVSVKKSIGKLTARTMRGREREREKIAQY